MNACLRHYQERGFSWLYKNAQLGLGSLLADDMGLGKTLLVITTLQKFKEEGLLKKTPALVIAPTTLLSNWKAEMERFAPSLIATIFHGTARQAEFKGVDVVITTYVIARTENERLCKQRWYTVVIDEAQNIKNTDTAQKKAVNKMENNQVCNLTKEQAALYKTITHDLMQEIENAEGINRKGIVLKLLTILKQVCNHPLQYLKNSTDIRAEQSGRMMLLLQLLETIYENGEKVLTFSQYEEMGSLLRTVIHEHFGKKSMQLHGGNTCKERDEMVHAFQNNPLSDTFISGTGQQCLLELSLRRQDGQA